MPDDDRLLAGQVSRYLEYRSVRLSANSVAAYRTDLRLLLRVLAAAANPQLDHADPGAIDQAAAALTVQVLTIDGLAAAFARIRAGVFRAAGTGPRSDASLRRIWATVNTFCIRLVDRRLLVGNPMAGVDNAATPDIHPTSLTADEAQALVAASGAAPPPGVRIRWPARDRALILTGLLAGLRASELTAMRIGDIHPGADGLYLRVIGKGGRARAIPLAAALVDALADYLRERISTGAPAAPEMIVGRLSITATRGTGRADQAGGPEGAGGEDRFPWGQVRPHDAPIFTTATGTPMSRYQLTRIVEHIYAGAGLARGRGVAVHALRHTFATDLHESGASTFEMQRLLGHSSPATTERYVRTTPADLRPLVNALRVGRNHAP